MAAVLARKIRVGTVGIALCFLATLFFVEAKTTWVAYGSQSTIGIASSKALAVDRSEAVFTDTEPTRPDQHFLSPILDLVVILSALLAAFASLRIRPHLGRRLAYLPAYFAYAHSVRPPPAR